MRDEIEAILSRMAKGEDEPEQTIDRLLDIVSKKVKEAYTDGFSDSRFDFNTENYLESKV